MQDKTHWQEGEKKGLGGSLFNNIRNTTDNKISLY